MPAWCFWETARPPGPRPSIAGQDCGAVARDATRRDAPAPTAGRGVGRGNASARAGIAGTIAIDATGGAEPPRWPVAYS